VFAGVQSAIAVMGMKDDDDDEPRGGRRRPIHIDTSRPAMVRAPAHAPRR